VKITYRTAEERQQHVNLLLEELQHNMDELMALARDATDINHDTPTPHRVRTSKTRRFT
jgi:hypothetical protein